MDVVDSMKQRYWALLRYQRHGWAHLRDRSRRAVLRSRGVCPICEQDSVFVARHAWLRDHFLCQRCRSIPRERALMVALARHFPHWRDLVVHESSPGGRGVSARLVRECRAYIPSQYFPDRPLGEVRDGVRCENLESLSFDDESIDLHITQDVMEHVFRPAEAFAEIARTLKPGGAHLLTVPLVRKSEPSVRRARLAQDGTVIHLQPPIFHGNPISSDGALVTVDWGYDICQHIVEASGLHTQTLYIDDLSRGIRAEYIEVLLCFKPARGMQPWRPI